MTAGTLATQLGCSCWCASRYVHDGLLDPTARPEWLRRLIPKKLPSGRASLLFQRP